MQPNLIQVLAKARGLLAVALITGCGDSDSPPNGSDEPQETATAQPESGGASSLQATNQHFIDVAGVRPDEGQAFWVSLPAAFAPMGSDADAPARSRLVLFEDDLALGPSNAPHAEIRGLGQGAYSHWQTGLYFSSSDGTDPRTNGRRYLIADVVDGWTSLAIPPGALRWRFNSELITQEIGKAWQIDAPSGWADIGSTVDEPYRSRMVLFENGRPLPRSNAPHALIRDEGGGSFSHWGTRVIFSISDNSDPRSNGNLYEAVLSDGLHSLAYLDTSRPVVAESVVMRETLAPPEWIRPGQEGELLGLTPIFEARHDRIDVLFYFEIDISDEFDSRNLLRWPRLAEGRDGPNPLVVLDPEANGGPRFQAPFRLSAMTLAHEADSNEVVPQAHRLIHGLPVGFTQVNEVVRFAAQQIYPSQSMEERVPAADVLAADNGTCGSINGLIQTMLDIVGYDTRLVAARVPRIAALGDPDGLGGHTGLEVFWDDAWRYVDGYYDVMSWGGDLTTVSDRSAKLDELFVYAPTGVLSEKDDAFRRVTLADYAGHVRYQHDLYASGVAAAEYVDPVPPGAPDPSLDRRALWPDDVLTLYARVRVARADPRQLRHLFPGREPELRFEAAELEVSPWVTRSIGIDLSRLPDR